MNLGPRLAIPAAVHNDPGRPAIPARFRPRYLGFEARKVRSTDNRDGLASAASAAAGATWTWTDLCEFNWGVRAPAEIEWCLAHLVGCHTRAADGSLRFADTDAPGIVYLPRPADLRATANDAIAAPARRLVALATLGSRHDTHNRLCVQAPTLLLFEPATGLLHRVPASILQILEAAASSLAAQRTQLIEQRLLPPEHSQFVAHLRALLRAAGRQEGREHDPSLPDWLCEFVVPSTRRLLHLPVPVWEHVRRTAAERDMVASTPLRAAFAADPMGGPDDLADEWCCSGADALHALLRSGPAAVVASMAAAWDALPTSIQSDLHRRHPGLFASAAARRSEFDAGPAARFARFAQGLDRLDALATQRPAPLTFADGSPAGTADCAGRAAVRCYMPSSSGMSMAETCNLALLEGADVRLRIRVDGAASGHFAAAVLLSAVPLEVDWLADTAAASAAGRPLRLGLGEHLNALCGRHEIAAAFVALEWSSSCAPDRWHLLGSVLGASDSEQRTLLRYQRWRVDWNGGRACFTLQVAGSDAAPIGGRRGIRADVEPECALHLLASVLAAADFHHLLQIDSAAFARLVQFGLLMAHRGGSPAPSTIDDAAAFPAALTEPSTIAAIAHNLVRPGASAMLDLLLPEAKALLLAALAGPTARADGLEVRAIVSLLRSARSPRETANILQRIPGTKATIAAGRSTLLGRLPVNARAAIERLVPVP